MLVTVTDIVDNLDQAVVAMEPFTTVVTAGNGAVLRGVWFSPGTEVGRHRRE